jgi:hypothetical protein
MKRAISLLLILLLSSCAQQVDSIKEDKDTLVANSNTGYLLIGIDLSYKVQYLDIGGENSIRLTEKDLQQGKRYFLIDMPAGEYAFKDISFNKWRSLELLKGYWDFQVQPNVISYVGHLKTSSYGFSTVAKLENRSSQALTYLEENFPTLLKSRKVRYHGPGEDPFFERVESTLEGGK